MRIKLGNLHLYVKIAANLQQVSFIVKFVATWLL